MKTKRLTLIALVCFVQALSLPLQACWVDPPEYRIQSSPEGGEFFLRNIKSEKTLEVWSAQTLKVVWKAKIDDYDSIFSVFKLSPDGKFLVHIKGNHMVGDVKEVCVEVYGTAGYRNSYKLSEMMGSLPEYKPEIAISTDPKYLWCLDVREPRNETIVIQLGDKRFASLSLAKHKVEINK
ncbi:MAG: hypothetical protein QM813_25895 [Verrucomicrobiota bacterium]